MAIERVNNREYELKFEIKPKDVERLMAHPRLAAEHRDVSKLISTYFDTPDATLRRNRVSLRTRQSGHTLTHTLKCATSSAVNRAEWEVTGTRLEPDKDWLRQTPLASLFNDRTMDRLEQRFTIDVTRTAFQLHYEGAKIEAALDEGEIRANGQTLSVSEFELELKEGSAAAVDSLAHLLAGDLPLVLSLTSKSERGYRIADSSWGRPTKTVSFRLDNRANLSQAFEAISQTCLHTVLLNTSLIGGRDDIEATHKARIALRRLRAAIQLFKPILRRKRLALLKRHLRRVSSELGRARDADVFQTDFFDKAATDGNIAGAPALALVMDGLRRSAHSKLLRFLTSRRWRLLLLDLLAFSSGGIRPSRADDRFGPFIQRRLEKHRARLVHLAKGLESMPAGQMHEVRKKAKMLHYELDFLKSAPPLIPKKRFQRLRNNLQTVQETLGSLHDQIALRDYLRKVMTGRSALEPTSFRTGMSAAFAAGLIAATPVSERRPIKASQKAILRLAKV